MESHITSEYGHLSAPPTDRHGELSGFVARLGELPRHSPEWERLREQIIRSHLDLVRETARRFQRRGIDLDDLMQVAAIGLIKAVDRFDATRQVAFAQYAVPTMVGEIKRHFRDHGWAVHVQRSLKDLHQDVNRVEPPLAQRLQRTPTVSDIAQELQVDVTEVHAAKGCAHAYQAYSLDAPTQAADAGVCLGDHVGMPDRNIDLAIDRIVLRAALARLDDREKQILQWRFEENLTQGQIACKLGLSQMHVSRLLSAIYAKVRVSMLGGEPSCSSSPG
jgi:RNA polymerase sigma-B factor